MKQKFRITFYGEIDVIFTTKIMAKNINSAKRIAKKLEPFEFNSVKIVNLTSEWNQKLDKLEFNY